MALIQLVFDNAIDFSSIQIGDLAYYIPVGANGVASEEPQLIGPIDNFGSDFIIVDANASFVATPGLFILFGKPMQAEESGLKGYYANVTLENSSKTYIELYAVSSETTISSK
tara:strand:+ start:1437 stop:1775 length:339 start_codon:yes stop_codon:yes gene_type:complete